MISLVAAIVGLTFAVVGIGLLVWSGLNRIADKLEVRNVLLTSMKHRGERLQAMRDKARTP